MTNKPERQLRCDYCDELLWLHEIVYVPGDDRILVPMTELWADWPEPPVFHVRCVDELSDGAITKAAAEYGPLLRVEALAALASLEGSDDITVAYDAHEVRRKLFGQ